MDATLKPSVLKAQRKEAKARKELEEKRKKRLQWHVKKKHYTAFFAPPQPSSLYKGIYGNVIGSLFKQPLTKRLYTINTWYPVRVPTDLFNTQFQKEYLIEARIRFQFKRLLNAYRIRKMNNKSTDMMDPITFCPIEHPIFVYSMKPLRRYIFEADSLNKGIRKNLYYSQYTIPSPKDPINVITNQPFTAPQLISIFEQLRATKQRIEDLSIFRSVGFCLPVWKRYMFRQLRLTAIKDELQNYQSYEGQDILADFIKDSMAAVNIPLTNFFEDVLSRAIQWYPGHPLLQLLRTLCIKYYESNIFKLDIHAILMMQFNNLFIRHYPSGDLWIQTRDRMLADSQAEAEAEAEDEDIIMD